MGLDRRTFLQRAGLGLLTLGVSQTGLSFFGGKDGFISNLNHYSQTLAASTPRKLALLVGINDYFNTQNLQGCVTDVELQKELLIYRFGFHPQDIITLTETQATKDAIETVFREHLSKQAKANDIIVFHFSGYGNRVKISSEDSESFQLVNSFLPSDGILSTKKQVVMNDFLEDTLLLLARSLSTDKVSLVLDTSHYNIGKTLEGNYRVRSFPEISERPNPEELAFQSQIKQNLNLSRKTPFPGIILRAAQANQVATEILGHNWSAGLFTYHLTQYLWEVIPASRIVIAISRTREQVELSASKQIPTLISANKSSRLMYYLMPSSVTGAEGIITKIEDNTIEAELTGLPAVVLDNYGLNSCFQIVSASSSENSSPTQSLYLVERKGLTATLSPLDKSAIDNEGIEIGQQIQEKIRVLPHNEGLIIALDSSLERIERVDATSALDGLNAVASIINAGEDVADCVLSKIQSPKVEDEKTGGYGLLTPGGRIIPKSVGLANEAVKLAVQRLNPSLETLLALKLWRLTLNQGSSGLGITATLERLDKTPQTWQRRDTRLVASLTCGGEKAANYQAKLSTCPQGLSPAILTESANSISELTKLPIGTEIQYRLENFGQQPIYVLFLAIDSAGNPLAFYNSLKNDSNNQNPPEQLKQQVIQPGKSLIIPENSDESPWKVMGASGLVEVFLICSLASFENTLQASQNIAASKRDNQQVRVLSKPLKIAEAILKDLHTVSAVKIDTLNFPPDSYVLDVNAWATLRFIYQVR